MNEIDDIIKLLIEDTEYEIADRLKENKERISKEPIWTWHDSTYRKIVVLSDIVLNNTQLVIRDYHNKITKTYTANNVSIKVKHGGK
jgi:hypothetical protein